MNPQDRFSDDFIDDLYFELIESDKTAVVYHTPDILRLRKETARYLDRLADEPDEAEFGSISLLLNSCYNDLEIAKESALFRYAFRLGVSMQAENPTDNHAES